MSSAVLLLMLLLSVCVLLILVMKIKLHAFIALLLASILMGLLTGMDLNQIIVSIGNGMGSTLGSLAVIIGLGSMFGKMLEISGGAERLARTFLGIFGEKKAPYAMLIAGFLVSIPVFFDVGFIILVPLVYALHKSTKKSILLFGIPLLAGLAVTHAFVPPTPGPILVANLVGADLGKVIFYGIICGIPAAIIAGPVWGKFISKRIYVKIPDYLEVDEKVITIKDNELPKFSTIFLLVILPIFLILLNTFSSAYLREGRIKNILQFIGNPIVALIIACIISFIVLGKFKGLNMNQIQDVCSSALNSTGIILLVTGAGGIFKQVLVDSKIGEAVAHIFDTVSISPIILAFLISLIVRVSAGSATVAMATAGAIVGPLIANASIEPALIVIAIASGSTALSHVNDSGFWLVNRYFGLNEKDTLKSWTVMESLIGVVGLITSLILSFFV